MPSKRDYGTVQRKLYEPQTREGKIADDAALQTDALLGRNVLRKARLSIITGTTLGTEVAGHGTDDNAAARFMGGIVGGGVPALAHACDPDLAPSSRTRRSAV